MSSSYSSLDWVLSHWVHFTVHSLDLVVFISVYFVFFSYCIYVVLLSAQWAEPNEIEAWSLGLLFLQCFDTVGWVFWPIKPVPDMTYNVFGGTLNLAQLNLMWLPSSSSVELRITDDPGRLWLAASQATDLSCHMPISTYASLCDDSLPMLPTNRWA